MFNLDLRCCRNTTRVVISPAKRALLLSMPYSLSAWYKPRDSRTHRATMTDDSVAEVAAADLDEDHGCLAESGAEGGGGRV